MLRANPNHYQSHRQANHGLGGMMKLSVEAKVAASVAAGFVALTVGEIAQGDSGNPGAGSNEYGTTNNPEVSVHMSQYGHRTSLTGCTNAEDNKGRTQWPRRE